MPPERVVYLLRQICRSLAEAHACGMLHRNIKPANPFLCRLGLEFDFVKVLDVGVVQTRRVDSPTAVTEALITAQQLIGTPAYMAPEMILGKDDVDRRADVYAIGCVAFYLLTGTRVFQDGTQMQALIDHVHEPPVPPSTRLRNPLPRELDQFVLDCLEKKPDDRPRHASALLERMDCIASRRRLLRSTGVRMVAGAVARTGGAARRAITGINRAACGIYQCDGACRQPFRRVRCLKPRIRT